MKDKINVDLTILTLVSISCAGLIVESLFERWEFWMAPVLFFGILLIWGLHIVQYKSEEFRQGVYLFYAAAASFFHGVHATSFFDVIVIFSMLMVLFSMYEKLYVINIIFVEYIIVMGFQFFLAFKTRSVVFDSLNISRTVLHFVAATAIYYMCRKRVRYAKYLKKQLDIKDNLLVNSDHDMEDFLTNISHELRTPVNVVNGMSTLLLQKDSNEEIEAIKEAGLRLSYQIEDIQDYTEIDRGDVVLENEKYLITSLVNDTLSALKLYNFSRMPEIVVDLDPKVPAVMIGDYKKLQKILRHLLDNSIKFTREGGIYIRILTVPRDYGVNLSIEVRDTGIGMSRDEIVKASSGFYQANKKRNRSSGGIGLGLNIVYGFVHKMRGFVKIESHLNKGTRVRVSIPQDVVDSRPCLSLEKGRVEDVVFFVNPKKYKVAEVRDYYRYMATNMAKGLECSLYPANTINEVEKLCDELNVTHIFMSDEEYYTNRSHFDALSNQGVTVIVAGINDVHTTYGSKVIIISKPLYGYSVSKVVNENASELDVVGDKITGKPYFEGVRTLIVDDEPMNLIVATGLFKDYGMITDTAESGKASLEKFSHNDYDIVFMDHMMPEMDGVEAMKRIKNIAEEKGRDIRVIALTANAVSGAKEMFVREGFDGFIAKPININDFERVMKNILPDSSVKYNHQ